LEVIQSPATPVPLQIDFIRALGWVETSKALDYLEQALAVVSVEGVQEIITVLGRVEPPGLKIRAAQILLDFFHSEHPAAQSISVRQALTQAWGHLGEQSAIDALLGLLADPADSTRLHAIAALKNFPTAHQQLEQLAIDENLTPALKQGIAIALAEW
jgi:HEAT repeat protein